MRAKVSYLFSRDKQDHREFGLSVNIEQDLYRERVEYDYDDGDYYLSETEQEPSIEHTSHVVGGTNVTAMLTFGRTWSIRWGLCARRRSRLHNRLPFSAKIG